MYKRESERDRCEKISSAVFSQYRQYFWKMDEVEKMQIKKKIIINFNFIIYK